LTMSKYLRSQYPSIERCMPRLDSKLFAGAIFRHLEELTASQFRPIGESSFHDAGLNLDCFEGVLRADGLRDNGWTAGAGGSNADCHTDVVCCVVPWQSAR
jgi:hypothetical protein